MLRIAAWVGSLALLFLAGMAFERSIFRSSLASKVLEQPKPYIGDAGRDPVRPAPVEKTPIDPVVLRAEIARAVGDAFDERARMVAQEQTEAKKMVTADNIRAYENAKSVVDRAASTGSWTPNDRVEMRKAAQGATREQYAALIQLVATRIDRGELRYDPGSPE
jgi:hypothetical protein